MRSHASSLWGVLVATALVASACEASERPAAHPSTPSSSRATPKGQGVGEAASGDTPGRGRHVTRLEGGVRRIDIADQQRYWIDSGFQELSPSVRVSVSSGALPRTAIYLRVPEGAAISVLPREDGGASLLFPPGSESDRVTLIRFSTPDGERAWTVADVRGTRIDATGQEWFHVYRPLDGQGHSALVGYEWRRGHDDEHELADSHLAQHLRTHARALHKRPAGEGYIARFLRLNDCASCHFPNKPGATDPDERLPPWPTDANAWYTFAAVVSDSAALSATPTFHDPNFDDPFVRATCTEGEALLRGRPRYRHYRCQDGSMPMGTRDVRRGLAEHHAYTESVCRSRAWLYERMDTKARAQFADAVSACNPQRRPSPLAH